VREKALAVLRVILRPRFQVSVFLLMPRLPRGWKPRSHSAPLSLS